MCVCVCVCVFWGKDRGSHSAEAVSSCVKCTSCETNPASGFCRAFESKLLNKCRRVFAFPPPALIPFWSGFLFSLDLIWRRVKSWRPHGLCVLVSSARWPECPSSWRPVGLSHVAPVGAPTWPSVPDRAAAVAAGAGPRVQMPEKTISWLGWVHRRQGL